MFETHFGLRENPFASGHQSRFVYPSREHQEAIAHLRYGLQNLEPFVLITGEVGTGKTTALFEALAEIQSQVTVALITNSALTRSELLEEICLRFGFALNPPVTKPQVLAALERHLLALRGRGQRAILLLDEAQNLDRELLEEIRLLSNLESNGEKLVQVFLVGQPELEAKLSRPELRQLRQRIAVHYRLRPLNAQDTERYIHHRITVAGGYAPEVFPREACAEVFAVTNGIPREINQICAQAMLDAYVSDAPSVLPEHVRAAAEETAFQSVLPAAETDPRLPPPAPWTATPGPAAVAAPVPPPAQPAPARPAPPLARTPEAPAAPPPTPWTPPAVAVPPAAPPVPPLAPPVPPVAAVPPAPELSPAAIEPLPSPVEEGPPALPEEPPAVESEVEAANWETWVASLIKSHEPAPVEDGTQQPAPPPPPAVSTPAASTPPTPAPPPRVQPPAPVEPPAQEPAPPARAGRLTEPASPSATEESERRQADWRPPMWTPEPPPVAGRRIVPLPSRLQEKLAEEERPSSTAMRWLVVAAVVAVVGITAVLTFRFKLWEMLPGAPGRPAAHQAATPTTATGEAGAAAVTPAPTPSPTIADSTSPAPAGAGTAAPPAVSGGGAPPATGATHPVTTPTAGAPGGATTQPPASAATQPQAPTAAVLRPPAPVPTTTSTVTPPRPATTMQYGIAVGTYLDRARADAELARLTGAAAITGRIGQVRQDNATMYAVILGAFPSRDAAERRASDLIARGLVDEARIIPRAVPAKP